MGRKEDVGGLIDYINDLRIKLSAREEVANEYKERIEKAVEYINENPFINSIAKVSIMNILRGDNDERKSN